MTHHAPVSQNPEGAGKPGAYLEQLSKLIFPLKRERRVIAVLAAYFDESGTHADSPVISMAGYIAPVEDWLRFSESWQGILTSHGLEVFHMSEYESRRGPFARLPRKARLPLIVGLIEAINTHVTKGIVTTFSTADYDAAIGQAGGSKIGTPWMLCASICMQSVREWAKRASHKEPIAVFFEKGAELSVAFQQAYNLESKSPNFETEYGLGALVLGDKRLFIPLQAADVLAYESYKDEYNKRLRQDLPGRKSLQALLKPDKVLKFSPDRKTLAAWLVRFEELTKDKE